MPLSQWNLEWLNHNAVRRYPLTEESTLVDQTGSFTIPTDFLVELDLPIHASIDADPDKFFIRQIGAYPTGYSITVSYVSDTGYVDVASASFPASGFTRNKTFALGGIEPFDDTIGKVVVGRMDNIDEQPSGLWNFDPDATTIEPDCIRPIIRGVQALYAVNGGSRSLPITGDIELVAGTNMRITPILVDGQNPQIRFDAITGAGLTETCICDGDNAVAPCVSRINGVAPGPDGAMNLVGDACIEINPLTNGLQIADKCCQPCCSCQELEAITTDLERFNTERATYELFMGELMAASTQMQLTVLGSRLGDKGCIQCQ